MKMRRGPWQFYVYALMHGDELLYVGKGTGYRLRNQRREFGVEGYELAHFAHEKDAYQFERKAISEHQPRLNRHAGGNGSMAKPVRVHCPDKVEREIRRIGTRLYAINLLKRFGRGFDLDWERLSIVEAELSGISNG